MAMFSLKDIKKNRQERTRKKNKKRNKIICVKKKVVIRSMVIRRKKIPQPSKASRWKLNFTFCTDNLHL